MPDLTLSDLGLTRFTDRGAARLAHITGGPDYTVPRRELSQPASIAATYADLARSYQALGDHHRAIEYLEQSLDLQHKAERMQEESTQQAVLPQILALQHRLDSALQRLEFFVCSVKQNSRLSPRKLPGKNRRKFPGFTVRSFH